MHRLWGGDLIGMTALPEAKLAREAEIPYALIALVTDYDCWKAVTPTAPGQPPPPPPEPGALLAEITANLETAAGKAMELIRRGVTEDCRGARNFVCMPGKGRPEIGDLVG